MPPPTESSRKLDPQKEGSVFKDFKFGKTIFETSKFKIVPFFYGPFCTKKKKKYKVVEYHLATLSLAMRKIIGKCDGKRPERRIFTPDNNDVVVVD